MFSLSDSCSKFEFQLGSSFSLHGCLFKHNEYEESTINHSSLDAEFGTYMVPTLDHESHTKEIAGVCGYIFQIIYQVIHFNDSIGFLLSLTMLQILLLNIKFV